MEKEFITYELALRMKALDYDEPCFAYFLNSILQYPAWEKDYSYFNEMSDINPGLKKREHVLAPTWQSAFRWFRAKYSICVEIHETTDWEEDNESWSFVIFKYKLGDNDGMISSIIDYDTYEEAELECLTKLIEIVEKELIN